MSNGSENMLVTADENVEAIRQEQANADSTLVELGKVSDTQGGFFGNKLDSGAGLMYY